MNAKSARARGNHARRGLAYRGDVDPTTRALLLRQLYLSLYAEGAYARAYDVACQAAEIGELADVMQQDAARAKQAIGDVDGAVAHLRLAVRQAPASRRAFHWWTLGSVLFLAGRHERAIEALARAARWGTHDKPLYQGHLALAKCHAGQRVRGLEGYIRRLAACPAGQGYGRFVLGQLAYESARFDDAKRYLEAFVDRTARAHRPLKIALDGELRMAKTTLKALDEAASG